MLLGNYTVLNKNPGRSFSGTLADSRPAWRQSGAARGRFTGFAGYSRLASTPNGYTPPGAWIMALSTGGIASYTLLGGFGAFTASVAGGVNGTATLAGLGVIATANAALIVSAAATLAGIGGLTADLNAILQASATLAGAGILTSAVIALGHAVAALTGTGAVTSTARATGALAATIDIGASDPLSAEALAASVWNALADDFVTVGTFGQLVGDNVDATRDAIIPHIWAK